MLSSRVGADLGAEIEARIELFGEFAGRLLGRLPLSRRQRRIARPARALSGGNQQKLVVGRECALPPKLLLASQPTRGLDIGALELIHRRLVALRDAGCAVLVVSADLDELTILADRLLVFQDGRIAGELDPQTATREQVGLLMSGVQ